jgi:hypothetical protein
MMDAVDKALETLKELLNSENDGFRLEAAREILKYAAQMRN